MSNRSLTGCARLACLALLLVAAPSAFAQCVSIGGVSQLDANTYDFNMGTTFSATASPQACSFPFSLPAPGSIRKLQGTVVFRSYCAGDTDAFISVNGGAKQTYHMKQKLGSGGGVSAVFVSYDIPLAYSGTTATLEFAAYLPPWCPAAGDWEFKGVMRVVKNLNHDDE